MNDNEIIKALECCAGEHACNNECPGNKVDCALEKYALDLINRQKAEIERLNKANERFAKEFDSYYAIVKSNAIKEFAERLKASQTITCHSTEGQCVYVYDDELIDTIAEELIGKEDEGK